jgi:hypothetical protein
MLKMYDKEANTNICVSDGSSSTIGAQAHHPNREIPL